MTWQSVEFDDQADTQIVGSLQVNLRFWRDCCRCVIANIKIGC